ncbi:MAG: hypothetical protein BWY94_02409 [Actinobacteria bacterium ADurb.BinA094]|nr:MAG: hypothetical protein BWY94_02409 [Actinobacteria bacterium ADurb.BinA094]
MIISDDVVKFASSDEWYEIERSGEKPATLRLLSHAEWSRLMHAAPERILIRRAESDGEAFVRRIRSTHVVGDLLGVVVVLICWEPEDA